MKFPYWAFVPLLGALVYFGFGPPFGFGLLFVAWMLRDCHEQVTPP